LNEAALNRQTKRQMKRQGGETPAPAERRRPAPPPPHRERTSPKVFVREVRGELKKVAWPTRPEVVTSTIVVLMAVIVMTLLIFGLDYVFAEGVLRLFEK
jgi:preprotein translocase subunit SecE